MYRTYGGPVKSTAAWENGLASLTQKEGSGGAGGGVYGFPRNCQQITHMSHLPRTNQ